MYKLSFETHPDFREERIRLLKEARGNKYKSFLSFKNDKALHKEILEEWLKGMEESLNVPNVIQFKDFRHNSNGLAPNTCQCTLVHKMTGQEMPINYLTLPDMDVYGNFMSAQGNRLYTLPYFLKNKASISLDKENQLRVEFDNFKLLANKEVLTISKKASWNALLGRLFPDCSIEEDIVNANVNLSFDNLLRDTTKEENIDVVIDHLGEINLLDQIKEIQEAILLNNLDTKARKIFSLKNNTKYNIINREVIGLSINSAIKKVKGEFIADANVVHGRLLYSDAIELIEKGYQYIKTGRSGRLVPLYSTITYGNPDSLDDIQLQAVQLCQFTNLPNVDNFISDILRSFNKRVVTTREILIEVFKERLDRQAHYILKHCRRVKNQSVRKDSSSSIEVYKFADDLYNQVIVSLNDFKIRLTKDLTLSEYAKAVDTSNVFSAIGQQFAVSVAGVGSKRVSEDYRKTNPAYFGRICALDTPQSSKVGLTTSLTIYAKVHPETGELLRPLYKLQHADGITKVRWENPIYVASHEETFHCTTADTVLPGGTASDTLVYAKVPYEDTHIFTYLPLSRCEYISPPICSVSPLAATTSGIGETEQIRNIYAHAQYRQVKPVNPDSARVSAGFEELGVLTDTQDVIAEDNGVVISSVKNMLTVKYDGEDIVRNIRLGVTLSDHSTINQQFTYLQAKDRFEQGDIIVYANYLKENLEYGKSALVAFYTDKDNYEDGITTSQGFAERIKSFRVYKQELSFDTAPAKVNKKIVDTRKRLDDKPLEIAVIDANFKRTVYDPDRSYTKTVSENIVVQNKDLQGYIFKSELKGSKLKLHSVQSKPAEAGTKLVNRHGNKGVVPKVVPDDEMYRLSNGKVIDINNNPLGSVQRLNLGGVTEPSLGLAAEVLDLKVIKPAHSNTTIDDIVRLVKNAYEVANGLPITKFPELPDSFYVHIESDEIKERAKEWAGVFNEYGEAYLYRGGTKTATPVLIGYAYTYILHQEVHKKEGKRGGLMTEQYKKQSAAPTKGSALKGGQSLGKMELDALIAAGAYNVIHEKYNEHGDNPVERYNLHARKAGKEPVDDTYSTRRSLVAATSYLLTCGIDTDLVDLKPEAVNARKIPKAIKFLEEKVEDVDTEEIMDFLN